MIRYLYLGRIAYPEALRLQEELVELRRDNRIPNVLLLLEHPPVLTLGRHANRANVLASDQFLASRGVTLHHINRGGDVTFHGPGQLVGYPIFDLRSLENPSGGRMGPVDFVRQMEEALIRLCAVYGVRAGRVAGLTGVWCRVSDQEIEPQENDTRRAPSISQSHREIGGKPHHGSTAPDAPRKIGAIGIHVSRGITSHGFAFNVTTDLGYFQLINPCGITDKPVSSLAHEASNLAVSDQSALPPLDQIAHQAARQFGHVFHQPLELVESLAALRASATEPSPAPETNSAPEDTTEPPLQIPEEVERLTGHSKRPVRA